MYRGRRRRNTTRRLWGRFPLGAKEYLIFYCFVLVTRQSAAATQPQCLEILVKNGERSVLKVPTTCASASKAEQRFKNHYKLEIVVILVCTFHTKLMQTPATSICNGQR